MGKRKPRHPNFMLVKIHRNYTVEEIASLFGKHENKALNRFETYTKFKSFKAYQRIFRSRRSRSSSVTQLQTESLTLRTTSNVCSSLSGRRLAISTLKR
jgi:hypothetical protein